MYEIHLLITSGLKDSNCTNYIMVYGYYHKTLKTKPAVGETCPGCGATNCMQLEVVSKISHYMFIPSWSGTPKVLVKCNICGNKYILDAFPDSWNDGHELQKNTSRRFYHFTGTFLILAFVVFVASMMIWGSIENKDRRKNEITNLKEGNVIVYELPDGKKTCMYVDSVGGDSVYVRENMLSTNKDAGRIDEPENYAEEQAIYTKSQLLKMEEDKLIKSIYFSTTYFYYNNPE